MRCNAPWVTVLACLVGAAFSNAGTARAETIQVPGSTGTAGIFLRGQDAAGVSIHYEIGSFAMEGVAIEGVSYQKISLPDVFLPNNAGAPDLPGFGRMLALPNGAVASVRILDAKTQVYRGIEVSPAPVIPKENEDGEPVYREDPAIYGRNASYPEQPVLLSKPGALRGISVVTLGVTPFQYNPVTKELVVYTELDLQVTFEGGNGQFGEERLRNRYWEPILAQHLLNYETVPPVDFSRPRGQRTGFDYVIICPDNVDFIAWADTLKAWRQLEGVSTEVFTTTEVGGITSTAIETFLNTAYNTWDPAPAAFLLLGDYPGSGDDVAITSPMYQGYCVSDNIYADVNGDHLPDMVHARITGRNYGELQTMVTKMLNYERHPYTDPGYYDRPLIAGGWQTERWFIICCEIVYGFQANVLGKHPTREYAIYSGYPGTQWSTNSNTPMLVSYFGPNGLGYIPSTPQHLTDWGGNATRINNDLNAGSYLLLHRDHGLETGWGEPAYGNANLPGLHNQFLPFVMSMNCLTGKYNWGGQSFTEAFHRMSQGAVGLIAASEVSYSFVNDAYIFGLMDSMWPEFMPAYGQSPPYSHFNTDNRTAFGMVSGKYFLQASNWPYNPQNKEVTYHLFHHHGDAFMTIYSEVPEPIAISHEDVCFIGTSTFRVTATPGAVVALTVNGQIVGVAEGTGVPQDIPITVQAVPGTLRVTATLANHYRYVGDVTILAPNGPYLLLQSYFIDDTQGDEDGELDAGEQVNVSLTLRNVGVDAASGLTATLSSVDPYAQVLTPTGAFPDIPPGQMRTILQPFSVQVLGTVPDGHEIPFAIRADAAQGSWDAGFARSAQAPVLHVTGAVIDDADPLGNGNGVADPGESFYLMVSVENVGSSGCAPVSGTLTSESFFVTIPDDQGESPAIPCGQEGTVRAFLVQLGQGCPTPAVIAFDLDLIASNGFAAGLDFGVDVGAWFDNAEGNRGWTFGVTGDNATAGVWTRAEPVGTMSAGQQCQPDFDHSPDPAQACFVTANGTPGGLPNDSDVDGGKTTLLSPAFRLHGATSAVLSYWRWYTNNLGSYPNQDYWDVEVTSDGTSWVRLEHTTASANEWDELIFDLSDYITLTDQVRIRFVADDSGYNSLVEAAVDDIRLAATFRPPTSAPEGGAPATTAGIVSVSPNPFHSRTDVVFRVPAKTTASLALYDVAGRKVRTLVDGSVEAGMHTVSIEADAAGRALASGIYFLRLQTPELTEMRQATILK